jgi:hypothetical protein
LEDAAKTFLKNISDIDKSYALLNHISLDKDYFVKFWNNKEFTLHGIPNLSFSYFISHLIYSIVGPNELPKSKKIWFPEEKSNLKEFSIEE